MKARLYVVDDSSYITTIKNMEITIKVPNPTGNSRKQWKKTLVDIMSDLFQIELGDYAFLWKNGGMIYGVYRIISKPYYISSGKDGKIFGLKIELAYEFENPIKEYDVLNEPALKGKMWNITGKKLAGKSRGSTPITKEEMQILIQMLHDANPDFIFYPSGPEIKVAHPLLINIVDDFIDYEPKDLSSLDIKKITLRHGKNVRYEKSLELLFNYYFRERSTKVNEIGIENDNVVWFANYLPYGIERSEIDYIVQESIDGENITRVDVIEFMKGAIDYDHIDRCLQYSRWCIDSLYGGNDIVRPILICGRTSSIDADVENAINSSKIDYHLHSMDIYTYEMTGKDIVFNKIY